VRSVSGPIPLSARNSAQPLGIAGDEGRDGMAKTVLIVEDNELNMKLFRDLLEAHGYQTSAPATASRRSISSASFVPT
jgi:hypothetical protein